MEQAGRLNYIFLKKITVKLSLKKCNTLPPHVCQCDANGALGSWMHEEKGFDFSSSATNHFTQVRATSLILIAGL